jgi:hypothetical protein
LAEATEIQPEAFVTVKLYVPTVRPEIVIVVVEPVRAPGLMVQVPAGKPFNITLPVAKAHVGWVIVPTVGAVGVTGCGLITTLTEATEVHPAELVTVKLYVPAVRLEIVVVVVEPV